MAFGGLKKWFEDRAKNVANVGSKAFDQANVFDNGRSWQTRTPTDTRSVADQAARQTYRAGVNIVKPVVQTLNTGKALGGVGFGLAKTGAASLFGSDQSYLDAVNGMTQSYNRDLAPKSGLLGVGTVFKSAKEAVNATPRTIAGKSINYGTQIGTMAAPVVPIKGFGAVGSRIANNALQSGVGSAVGQAVETGRVNPRQLAMDTATGTALGEIAPVASKAGSAAAAALRGTPTIKPQPVRARPDEIAALKGFLDKEYGTTPGGAPKPNEINLLVRDKQAAAKRLQIPTDRGSELQNIRAFLDTVGSTKVPQYAQQAAPRPGIVQNLKDIGQKVVAWDKARGEGGFVANPFTKGEPTRIPVKKDPLIQEYANVLKSMGEGNGVSVNKETGARISNNFRTADTKGKGKVDWYSEAESQVKAGKADPAFMEYYNSQKQTVNLPKQLAEDARMQRAMTGGTQYLDPELQSLIDRRATDAPTGFITQETKPRAGKKDTIRVKAGDNGLQRTIQSEPALTKIPQLQEAPIGAPKNLPGMPDALDLKSKPAKADFLDSTRQFIGKKDAAKTNNTVIARTLPKLDSNQSLGLMDAVQQGMETGDFSGAPTQVRSILDAKYKELTDAGVDIGYLENYFPQKWQNASADEVNRAYQTLNMKAGIMQPRTIPTIQEGIALGYKPLTTDYRQAVANYLNTADKVLANRQYFGELKSKGLIAEAGTRPQGMQLIDAPGLPQPRPFNDPETGAQVQGAYYAKPDVAKKLNRMFGDQTPDSGFEKVLDKTAKASSTLQDFGLSGGIPGTPINAFTIAQGTKEVLAGNLKSPFVATMKSFTAEGSNKYFAKHAADVAEMQSKGIPVRSDFSIDAKTLGKDFAEATGIRGKAKQVWEHAFNDPTFQRFMPILQTEMYNKVKAKHGADVAAEAVKNFYGITDVAKQATRSKTGNDFVTTAFFAPKYRESMINFWKQNAKALGNPTDPAYRQNLKFIAGAALSAVAMDYVNQYYNNGDHMWDNPDGKKDKALGVTVGGKQVGIPFLSSIATVPRNVASLGFNLATGNLEQAKKDAGSFLGYGIRPVADVLNNENYFGSQITKEGDTAGQRLKDVGGYLAGQYNHPYVREAINAATGKNKSVAETASKASELPLRFYDPAYYKYGGKGLNKDQRGELTKVPQDGRQDFIKSSIERNKLVAKANEQKKELRGKESSDLTKLANGQYYVKIGKTYRTFNNEQDAKKAVEKYGSRKSSAGKLKTPTKKSSTRKTSGRSGGRKVSIPKLSYTNLTAKSTFTPGQIKAPKVAGGLKRSGGVQRRGKVKVRVA